MESAMKEPSSSAAQGPAPSDAHKNNASSTSTSTPRTLPEEDVECGLGALSTVATIPRPAENAAIGECRICLQTDRLDQMCSPCGCTGTMNFTHQECLTAWIKERRSGTCELCHKEYSEPFKSILEDYLHHYPVSSSSYDGPYMARHEPLAMEHAGSGSWRTFWFHTLILSALLGAVIYLTCFSPVMDSGAGWTSIIWRVLTVIIPVYIIGRISWALYMRWKAEHAMVAETAAAANAAQDRALQMEDEEEQHHQRAVAMLRDSRLRSIVVVGSDASDTQQAAAAAGQEGAGTGRSAAEADQPRGHLDVELASTGQQQQQQQQEQQQGQQEQEQQQGQQEQEQQQGQQEQEQQQGQQEQEQQQGQQRQQELQKEQQELQKEQQGQQQQQQQGQHQQGEQQLGPQQP